MNKLHAASRELARIGVRISNLLGDRRGVAAVEFAFIAPLLLSLYFVTMEVAQGIETNKKIGRVSSMVADLVTQQQTITKSEIDAIMKIGESTLQPYNRTVPKIVVTAIQITDETTPKVLVVWSRKMENGSYSREAAPGTVTTVPEKLKIKGTFLIRVDAHLDYRPVITWTASQKQTLGLMAAFDNINMRETYYLRPRMSSEIPCGDC
jgi:Flp pilus assembly protein TadG